MKNTVTVIAGLILTFATHAQAFQTCSDRVQAIEKATNLPYSSEQLRSEVEAKFVNLYANPNNTQAYKQQLFEAYINMVCLENVILGGKQHFFGSRVAPEFLNGSGAPPRRNNENLIYYDLSKQFAGDVFRRRKSATY